MLRRCFCNFGAGPLTRTRGLSSPVCLPGAPLSPPSLSVSYSFAVSIPPRRSREPSGKYVGRKGILSVVGFLRSLRQPVDWPNSFVFIYFGIYKLTHRGVQFRLKITRIGVLSVTDDLTVFSFFWIKIVSLRKYWHVFGNSRLVSIFRKIVDGGVRSESSLPSGWQKFATAR